jgi:PHD/YefM family antitoxin component YafN of YafNO toxin-antitoxin module
VLASSFGPGAQPAITTSDKARTPSKSAFFITSPPDSIEIELLLDKTFVLWYNMARLANVTNLEVGMTTKTIPSTEAQNNFGRILDDVIQNGTRYVIKRRDTPQAILLSLSDLERLLTANEIERKEIGNVIRELSPVYNLGETVKQ